MSKRIEHVPACISLNNFMQDTTKRVAFQIRNVKQRIAQIFRAQATLRRKSPEDLFEEIVVKAFRPRANKGAK